jgi:hypothetical protein
METLSDNETSAHVVEALDVEEALKQALNIE